MSEVIQKLRRSEKTNLQGKHIRETYFKEEKRKTKDTADLTKKWQHEQKQRETQLNKYLHQTHERAQQEQEEQDKLTRQKELKQREEYYSNLEAMKAKKAEREHQQQELKQHSKSFKFLSQKPLYQEIQERFSQEQELPLLEQRKAELAKLRMMKNSVQSSDLKKHLKWYSEQKKKKDPSLYISKQHSFSSTLGNRLFLEDKADLDRNEQFYHEKLQLIQQSKQFAQKTREEHRPKHDPNKAEEVQKRIYRFPHSKRSFENKLALSVSTVIKSGPEPRSKWRPRQLHRNPLVPEPPSKMDSKSIDYLAERRREREENPVNPRGLPAKLGDPQEGRGDQNEFRENQ